MDDPNYLFWYTVNNNLNKIGHMQKSKVVVNEVWSSILVVILEKERQNLQHNIQM